jgi:hypothetical protein
VHDDADDAAAESLLLFRLRLQQLIEHAPRPRERESETPRSLCEKLSAATTGGIFTRLSFGEADH